MDYLELFLVDPIGANIKRSLGNLRTPTRSETLAFVDNKRMLHLGGREWLTIRYSTV